MSPEQIARRYYAFFNNRDLDSASQLVDRAASFRYLPSKQRLIGRAGYRALANMWLSAFADGRLEVVSISPQGDDTLVVDILGSGTQTGDLVLGDALTIPATGIAGALSFRETLKFQNNLIVDVELDFNMDQLKQQLLGQ